MKKIIKNIVPSTIRSSLKRFKREWIDGYQLKSYSQEGEDLILREIFKQQQGFYVDVGAHHPQRFSNTYWFYKKGWYGINIDAMPGSMVKFKKIRPRDVNLEVAIAANEKEMTFFSFSDPAINTFDEKLAALRVKQNYSLINKEKIKAMPLQKILKDNLPKDINIDFMSIDVEGLDLEVVQSNDWQIFRPRCILVESLNATINKIKADPIYNFAIEQKYELFAKTCRTLIFIDVR